MVVTSTHLLMQIDRDVSATKADASWRFGIVYSDFYKEEMQTMVEAAIETLKTSGVSDDNIVSVPVSGSFEIPLIGRELVEQGKVDALIGLGIIVEGETHHARLIAENCARGMMDIQTTYGVPFVNEVLYVDMLELAKVRLSKGKDAALSAIDSLALLARLQS